MADRKRNENTRRAFLRHSAVGAGATWGLTEFPFLGKLPSVSAAETAVQPDEVRFGAGVDSLVRLLEETPREKLLEQVARKLRRGTTYREVLAALLLAAVRNVEPRPSVGFKFHAVLVVNSAHLASLASPNADRWLPIFWAIDYFKSKQLEEEGRNGWKLQPVNEKSVPPAHQAKAALIKALETWDEEAADGAVTALARTAGAAEVFAVLAHYGCRDFRSIGHKAIYVANSRRALDCIGWQFAEPVLRSLVYAMLNHTGEPNPGSSDLEPDRPWRRNMELHRKIRAEWRGGKRDEAASRKLTATLRKASADDACDAVVDALNAGVSPRSVWDGVFLAAGEMLMQQPGIIGLHGLTTTNAMHYAFTQAGDDDTRRLLLLQNAAFVPMFRKAAARRGRIGTTTIDDVTQAGKQHSSPNLEEIFRDVSGKRQNAAAKTSAYLAAGGKADDFIHQARRLIFLKGRDAHDYKFSSAVLEDYHHVSPALRDLFLSLSVFNLKGTSSRDSNLVERTRAALDS